MKKVLIIIGILFALILIGCGVAVSIYFNNLKPVSDNDTPIELEVKVGSTYYTMADILHEKKLIRSSLAFKIYLRLNPPTKSLEAGMYELRADMSVKEIVEALGGGTIGIDTLSITFKEGWNMRAIAKEIELKTNNTEEDVFALLNDKEYIESLITKYWFIEEIVLSSDIYYPLEGYLFPNTYRFKDEDVTVKEIFAKMLDEMSKQLTPYKAEIESSKYSIHELLTLASLIELEAGNADDRAGVSGVFYNRLKDNWTLGSDVTTYYALKIDDWKFSLTAATGLYDCSTKYNTRCTSFVGLPIGPICNVGLESLVATLKPSKHDYYYFVADCKGKTYMRKTNSEHQAIIEKLRKENNWCET